MVPMKLTSNTGARADLDGSIEAGLDGVLGSGMIVMDLWVGEHAPLASDTGAVDRYPQVRCDHNLPGNMISSGKDHPLIHFGMPALCSPSR